MGGGPNFRLSAFSFAFVFIARKMVYSVVLSGATDGMAIRSEIVSHLPPRDGVADGQCEKCRYELT